jgi:basic membrane protein A and related proteins
VSTKHLRRMAALFALVAVVATACGDDDDDDVSSDTEAATDTSAATDETTADTEATTDETEAATDSSSEGAGTGTETEDVPVITGDCIGEVGCVPDGQPDVNGDGTVKIGVLSPGDTNDNGYYESFVVTAQQFADENGWELVIVDNINPADAQEQARNICRQSVDMVAVSAGELADAIPVAEEDVCAGTVWYVAAGDGVEQTPYFFQTTDDVYEGQYAVGVATGHVMEAQGFTTAGFVTGPELDFSVNAFNSWTAGIHSVLPDAETIASYTGDFDDSAVAVEGAQAQIDQGVEILYPYLGGATDAVVALGAETGIQSITPGTNRCAEPDFAISALFSPGEYFFGVLETFAAGEIQLGVTRTFRLGVDPVPNVVICDSVEGAEELNAAVQEVVAQIGAGEVDVQALVAAEG